MADVETDETVTLIASNKVEGTAVYNPEGEKLGSIYNFMVDKKAGKVSYAVLQFGGILGIGSEYYPLPWDVLTYDTGKGGYVVALSRETLENAPRYTAGDEPPYDLAYANQIHAYYGLPTPIVL